VPPFDVLLGDTPFMVLEFCGDATCLLLSFGILPCDVLFGDTPLMIHEFCGDATFIFLLLLLQFIFLV
jgi:hypothetical protein